ncbi:ParA family protein [Reichenbachiella agarivorans]|uniref:ParA family protein n=1 Tax=Reichenbachiella agarivorans TaxID=2979464 RepID=A0ABY6CMW1_9BACT|nr:ParA family protein [Reichenbachiella agarivorans]UXP31094.1 ParA family protein [Reichenbachiella agarivorans]
MIITVINQKGGTGKTTTSVNLGCALAEAKKKVLMIDLDPQGNLSYWLGIGEVDKTMADVMMLDNKITDVIVKKEGVSIAPSDVSLSDVEINIASMNQRESILKNALSEVESDYDYVIIDCPPSLSLLTVNALTATDRVIVPLQMEVLSLQGLDQIVGSIARIKSVLNSNLEILGLLPVMVDRRRNLSREIYEYIEENYDLKLFESSIRSNVRVSEAPSFGVSVMSYSPNSTGATDYRAFAKEILKLTKNKK